MIQNAQGGSPKGDPPHFLLLDTVTAAISATTGTVSGAMARAVSAVRAANTFFSAFFSFDNISRRQTDNRHKNKNYNYIHIIYLYLDTEFVPCAFSAYSAARLLFALTMRYATIATIAKIIVFFINFDFLLLIFFC